MKYPIIINENGDISFFENLQLAENYLEPLDIEHIEYHIYDAKGKKLFPQIVEKIKNILYFFPIKYKTVVLKSREESVNENALFELLLNFLNRTNIENENLDSLDDIIKILIEKLGYTV